MKKVCHKNHAPCVINSAFCILNSTFSSAFSLIELIIVMIIVSVLTTVAIIRSTGVDSQSSRVAANELRAYLTYIRNMAMDGERATRVRFYVVSNSYDVYVAVSNMSGTYQPARDPVTQKDWVVDLNSKFSGAALSTVSFNGGDTLYFSETNGTPFGMGGVMLTNNGVITFKDSAVRITVTPVTGYANLIEKKIIAGPIEPIPIEPEPLP